MSERPRFWEREPIGGLSESEWEAVCDGCAKCCLHKLEDDVTGQVRYTSVACRLLDLEFCRCRDYANRHQLVPECLELDPAEASKCEWLPQTCAYRRLAEGDTLPPWHPLLSGHRESVHDAGVSIRAWATAEAEVGSGEDLADYVLDADL